MEKNLSMVSASNTERLHNIHWHRGACAYWRRMKRLHMDLLGSNSEGRLDFHKKKFDAKDWWVAWSSGLAPGLLPRWFWFETEHGWPFCISEFSFRMNSLHPRFPRMGKFPLPHTSLWRLGDAKSACRRNFKENRHRVGNQQRRC